jgi:hypothetical protein
MRIQQGRGKITIAKTVCISTGKKGDACHRTRLMRIHCAIIIAAAASANPDHNIKNE